MSAATRALSRLFHRYASEVIACNTKETMPPLARPSALMFLLTIIDNFTLQYKSFQKISQLPPCAALRYLYLPPRPTTVEEVYRWELLPSIVYFGRFLFIEEMVFLRVQYASVALYFTPCSMHDAGTTPPHVPLPHHCIIDNDIDGKSALLNFGIWG